MDKPVMIFGANSLTTAVIEIFESRNIEVFGVLDDNEESQGREYGDVPVLGKTTDDGFLKYIGKKAEAFIVSDEISLRKSLVKMLNEKRKVMPVNAIHDHAHLSKSTAIGHGNFINSGSRIGSDTELGNHLIINSNVTIENNCHIMDFVQVGAGSVIGSGVTVEEDVFIGTGATIVPGVKIGKGARIGAGSVVINNIEKKQTVFGNPATTVEN